MGFLFPKPVSFSRTLCFNSSQGLMKFTPVIVWPSDNNPLIEHLMHPRKNGMLSCIIMLNLTLWNVALLTCKDFTYSYETWHKKHFLSNEFSSISTWNFHQNWEIVSNTHFAGNFFIDNCSLNMYVAHFLKLFTAAALPQILKYRYVYYRMNFLALYETRHLNTRIHL